MSQRVFMVVCVCFVDQLGVYAMRLQCTFAFLVGVPLLVLDPLFLRGRGVTRETGNGELVIRAPALPQAASRVGGEGKRERESVCVCWCVCVCVCVCDRGREQR